jgi:hypothetical protein
MRRMGASCKVALGDGPGACADRADEPQRDEQRATCGILGVVARGARRACSSRQGRAAVREPSDGSRPAMAGVRVQVPTVLNPVAASSPEVFQL